MKFLYVYAFLGFDFATCLARDPSTLPADRDVSTRPTATLVDAVKAGDLALALELLRAGASPDEGEDQPIAIAVTKGNAAMVKLLLDHHASPDATNGFGCSALYLAVFFNKEDLVDKLLAAGAKVVPPSGPSPLHAAARDDLGSLVVKLISKGADPNYRSSNGMAPLHAAAIAGASSSVQQLLKAGADANAQDSFGQTPLHFALRSAGRNAAVIDLLKDAGGVDLPR